MKGTMHTQLFSFLCVGLFLWRNHCVSGTFPKAQNITWNSLNFKTLLTWSPKPVNYSYTVEFNKQNQDAQRSRLCIQISDTECDLTTELKDLKGRYRADVLSGPVRGGSSDLVELPYTTSSWFTPYEDTMISKPEFKIKESEDQRTITLYVVDVPTALFNEQNKMLTIRDIFKDDLQYKVFYRKATSTGKKEKTSPSGEIQLTDLDRGESYCFNVQAYIPSRSPGKQLGELSHVQCSSGQGNKSIFEEYSLAVIAAGILSIIVIISAFIAGIVMCCKHQQKAKRRGKEHVPLREV